MKDAKHKALKAKMGKKAHEIRANAPSFNPIRKSIERKFVRGDERSASHRRRQDKAYNRIMGLDK